MDPSLATSEQPQGPPPGAVATPILSASGPPPGAVATPIAPQASSAAAPPAQQPAPSGWTRVSDLMQSTADNLDAPLVDSTKGLVKGGMHTVAGLLNILGNQRQQAQGGDAAPPDSIAQHTKDAATWLNDHAQDHGIWQHIGDFGESALELMTPEGLAGLVGDAGKAKTAVTAASKVGEVAGAAQKMTDAATVAKTLDKFPRIKALVMIGAKAAAKAGIEVGGQTYVKSGGDADAAVTAGTEAAALGGVGAPLLTAAGAGAGKLADALRKPTAEPAADLVGKLDGVLNAVGPAADKEATGAAVGKTVDKLKDVAAQHANAAYNPLKAPLGLAENATRDEILTAAQKAAEDRPGTLLDANGQPTTVPGDGGKALADLKAADTAYGESRTMTDRALVKRLANANRPELMHDYIAKASLADMRAVLPELDAPTQAAVARNVMEDVIAKGGDPASFNAKTALSALQKLDKDGAKSSLLFGDTNAAALKKNLQDIAAATKTPGDRAAFNFAVNHIGHILGAGAGAKAGYEVGGGTGAVMGAAAGGLGGQAVIRAIVANPRIAQNLLFAIQSGARPERYGPLIGAMIQQANMPDGAAESEK